MFVVFQCVVQLTFSFIMKKPKQKNTNNTTMSSNNDNNIKTTTETQNSIESDELKLTKKIDAQYTDIIKYISDYNYNNGQVTKVIGAEVDHNEYKKLCKIVSKQKNITGLVYWCGRQKHNNQHVTLIRWPYFDIEFIIDARENGRVGMTGKQENIKRMIEQVGFIPHTYSVVKKPIQN